jgi:exopolyphosphatase
VLAYLRTYTTPDTNTLYIPLSNLRHADLALRPELIPALSHASLEPNDLITLSDLPQANLLPSRLPAEKTSWILVDHNVLQGELGRAYGSRLFGCIDHHDEERAVSLDCGAEPRIVQKSGSCSSLVVEYCREAWDASSKKSNDTDTAHWDSEIAQLALAPILIDTANLTDKYKVTDVDIKAAKYLESKILAKPGVRFNRDEYFEKIAAAKNDIGNLSLPDILRKDYKQWTEAGSVNLGISSVVKDIQFLIDKAGSKVKFFAAVKDFAQERDLAIFSIMTTSKKDGVFQRELLVWGLDEKGAQIAERFGDGAKEKLGLEQWENGSIDFRDENQWRSCWWQRKVENSRKQVAPLLRSYI